MDAVTVLSIITIIVKLRAVTLPALLQAALWFMILGWVGVGLLVILNHIWDLESLNKGAVASTTERLSKQFPWLEESRTSGRPWIPESPWRDLALLPFIIPVLGYLWYAIVSNSRCGRTRRI